MKALYFIGLLSVALAGCTTLVQPAPVAHVYTPSSVAVAPAYVTPNTVVVPAY